MIGAQAEGVRITALRQEFERARDECKASYARKLTLLRKKYADIRRKEVAAIEQNKNIHIAAVPLSLVVLKRVKCDGWI